MHILSNSAREQIDLSVVVTRVQSPAEARSLPRGTVVGDTHGGVTFSDMVAAELEKRSFVGWRDVRDGASRHSWTIIILNR